MAAAAPLVRACPGAPRRGGRRARVQDAPEAHGACKSAPAAGSVVGEGLWRCSWAARTRSCRAVAAAGAGSGDLFAARAAAARLARPCCAPGEWRYISANGLASLAPSGRRWGCFSRDTRGGGKDFSPDWVGLGLGECKDTRRCASGIERARSRVSTPKSYTQPTIATAGAKPSCTPSSKLRAASGTSSWPHSCWSSSSRARPSRKLFPRPEAVLARHALTSRSTSWSTRACYVSCMKGLTQW
jgi:hypothetical protein